MCELFADPAAMSGEEKDEFEAEMKLSELKVPGDFACILAVFNGVERS
ncbi:hypothetical protein [Hahella sp. HN01]|nr:hypothetical protein [Hahella sp. HN01]MBU6953378.1 hypothetical protein [Hahella sp. HN01]